MSDDNKDEKWAASIAFVGNKETVKKILDFVENLDNNGSLSDYTGIEGPFDSLQLMLKRRAENLALDVGISALAISDKSEVPNLDAKGDKSGDSSE